MLEIKLKKCPFCGHEEAYVYQRYSTNYGGNWFVFVKCEYCGAQSGAITSKDGEPAEMDWDCIAVKKVVDAWNMRAKK